MSAALAGTMFGRAETATMRAVKAKKRDLDCIFDGALNTTRGTASLYLLKWIKLRHISAEGWRTYRDG